MVKILTLQSFHSIKNTTPVGECTELPSLPKSFAGMRPASFPMTALGNRALWKRVGDEIRAMRAMIGNSQKSWPKLERLAAKGEQSHWADRYQREKDPLSRRSSVTDLVQDWPSIPLSLPHASHCPTCTDRDRSHAVLSSLSSKGVIQPIKRLCTCACNSCKF